MLKTVALIKPDAVKKNLIGKILAEAEKAGLTINSLRMMTLSREQAGEFYSVHKGKPFYEPLTEFISEGPIVVAILAGDNCIEEWRRIMGATDPEEAAEGTIRNLYGESVSRNAVHGSDSPESAESEISFFARFL